MVNLIIQYFTRAKTYSLPRLLFEFTALQLIFKFLASWLLILILLPIGLFLGDIGWSFNQVFTGQSILEPIKEILITVFIGPPLETIFLQAIPIWLVSLFTPSLFIRIAVSTVLFSLIHVFPVIVITAAFPAGILLAWTFIIKSEESKWKAFWVTTVLHSFFNLASFLMRIGLGI